MDTNAFIQWALESARSNEEKYTVELIVETAMQLWHLRHQTGVMEPPEVFEERRRQRKLNPAYVASYSEENLRRVAEVLPSLRRWQHIPFADRPIRDLKAFEFLDLESLELPTCEVVDLEPVARMLRLESLTFSSPECSDFRPLGHCLTLKFLKVTFLVPWPEVSGLERLQELEEVQLSGNLLALPPGIIWPKVQRGELTCSPLAARSCGDLPALPNCLLLTLTGVDRLDGIEKMARLRNLTLHGPVWDYSPLAALKDLTCFAHEGDRPREVRPLIQLPNLQYVEFGDPFLSNAPRDYSPLAEAPMLRELEVLGCPPVEMEVAAINAGLAHWDDLFLAPNPQPVPPLRIIVAAAEPGIPPKSSDQQTASFIDVGLRRREGVWVQEFIRKALVESTQLEEWGIIAVNGLDRSFHLEIRAVEIVETFPEFIQTVRECLARLRDRYTGGLVISLEYPTPKLSSADMTREEELRELQEDDEFDQWQRDQEDYLDRLHRYELKKQEGGPIDPKEFSVPEPPQRAKWEDAEGLEEDEEFEEDFEEEEEDMEEPERFILMGEHPLADQYRLTAEICLESIRFHPDQREIASKLMRKPV